MIRLNVGCATNVFLGFVNIDREDMEENYFRHIRGLDPDRLDHGWSKEQKDHVRWLNAGALEFVQHDLRKGFPQYADGSVGAIYCGQIIEHLNPLHEAPQFLAECYRMLAPGGRIRLTTPDLDALLEGWRYNKLGEFEDDQPAFYKGALPEDQLAYIMYGAGGTAEKYEGHQHLYTVRSLWKRLEAVGFKVPDAHSGLFAGCIDKGMSHSFALEGVK